MPRAGLGADSVTRAGAELADEAVLDHLSMGDLAERLGIKAPISIVLTSTITIDATPAQVWDVLTDFPSYDEWGNFSRVDGTAEHGTRLHIRMPGMSFRPCVTAATIHEELEWSATIVSERLFLGRHTFRLADHRDGTTLVTNTETFSGASVRPFGRFFANSRADDGCAAFNRALKERVEARSRRSAEQVASADPDRARCSRDFIRSTLPGPEIVAMLHIVNIAVRGESLPIENASSPWRRRVGSQTGRLTGRTSAEPATGGAGSVMSVEGVDLHVRADGPLGGPVLLMLHGFGASSAWFDHVVARLPECRIIRVDLLGHGGSARPTSGYDPDSQGRLYACLLAELELEDATLVGHSMGSLFGVATAEHSTRITRLVLMGEGPDTAVGSLPPGEWVIHLPRIGPILQHHGPAFITRRVVRRAFARGFDMATAFADPDQGFDDARSLNHPAFTESIRRRKTWTDQHGLDARLEDLALPALVIFGREDRFYDVEASIARYRTVPTVTTTVLEQVGHTPMIEAPDRVADLIREFLSSGSATLSQCET